MADRRACLRLAGPLTCAAGVDVEQVRDEDGRLPCLVIRGVTGAVACDLRELPERPTARDLGPMSAALERAAAGRCPECDGPVDQEHQLPNDGPLVALPCRHALRVLDDRAMRREPR